jgi:hypothetical protein
MYEGTGQALGNETRLGHFARPVWPNNNTIGTRASARQRDEISRRTQESWRFITVHDTSAPTFLQSLHLTNPVRLKRSGTSFPSQDASVPLHSPTPTPLPPTPRNIPIRFPALLLVPLAITTAVSTCSLSRRSSTRHVSINPCRTTAAITPRRRFAVGRAAGRASAFAVTSSRR